MRRGFLPRRIRGRRRSGARGPLLATPFFAFGGTPFRDAWLVSVIVAQHRRGRPLAEILDDPLLRRFGSARERILANPRLIEALRADIVEEIGSPAASGSARDRSARETPGDGVSIIDMVRALHE